MYKKIFTILKNKYVIVLIFFIAWVGFIDNNNLIRTLKTRKSLRELRANKEYYIKEIAENQRIIKELTYNKASFEKFARETYFFKKPSEEIFIIEVED